jgi:hypothetical protein
MKSPPPSPKISLSSIDVANVNADTKLEPVFLRDPNVLFGHAALDFHSTARCIHRGRQWLLIGW